MLSGILDSILSLAQFIIYLESLDLNKISFFQLNVNSLFALKLFKLKKENTLCGVPLILAT